MVACNVGVTKTPLGSVLVVTEMAGLTLLPTTLIAAVVALLLTSNVDADRQPAPPGRPGGADRRGRDRPLAAPRGTEPPPTRPA